ncbi:SAFB-like transcription modulator [Diabrotica virgifera virgifera]|uniref:SAFB-like transcription modulator n=1 Tax=Diabrotica virgifera virgifera TaxID=50390 RepID=A0A6P7H0T3_DIAVI|nr:SAFB-like transcription modulator [Diabrotica virgifera virgifera]
MSEVESRKLADLRVIDLRLELERRGLDKNGVKQALLERLTKHLTDQGFDPATYIFKKNEQNEAFEDTEEDGKSKKSNEGSKKVTDGHDSPILLSLEEDEGANNADKKKREDSNQSSSGQASSGTTNGENSENRARDSKNEKKLGSKSNPTVVWISNLAENTRASDLKQALSACGRVTGAKIVVNARFPGSCCFGYVTMGSVEDVENVIEKLNNTELKGQMIKIEKYDLVRAVQLKKNEKSQTSSKDTQPKVKNPKKDDKSEKKGEGKKTDSETPVGRSEADRARSRGRRDSRDKLSVRPHSRVRHERDVLTFDKIREERDRQRLREKERILRDEIRRRREEASRNREVERRQQIEARRLEREKKKLEVEKERIAREKVALARIEREAHWEKQKKMEYDMTNMYEKDMDRRVSKRSAPFRREEFERKRPAYDRHFNEPPPPPSLKTREASPQSFSSRSKELYTKSVKYSVPKRDSLYPEKRREYDIGRPPIMGRQVADSYESRDARAVGHPRSKEARFEAPNRDTGRERSPHFRSGREERRPVNMKLDMPSGPSRDVGQRNIENRAGPVPWANNPHKPIGSNTAPKFFEKEPWRPNDFPRWSSQITPSRPFGNMGGPVCPPPPTINTYPDSRFNSGIRKY